MTIVPGLSHVPDLEQLEALAVTAGAGSMSAAARQLGVSQQAVSARISAAERLLGVAVFERSTRGVAATPTGEVVLAGVRDVLDAASGLAVTAASLRSRGAGHVRVAASNTVSECLLPGWAGLLRAERPDVRLHWTPGNSEAVLDAVATGQVDLGFVEGPTVPRTLRSRVVAKDSLVVVVTPDHPWARVTDGISVTELRRTPLVLREAGSGTRERLDEAVPDRVTPAQVLRSTAAVRDAARTLGAPTVLSSLAVEWDLTTGRLVEVHVRDLAMPRRLRAVWHPNQRPRGAAADLLRIAGARADPVRRP